MRNLSLTVLIILFSCALSRAVVTEANTGHALAIDDGLGVGDEPHNWIANLDPLSIALRASTTTKAPHIIYYTNKDGIPGGAFYKKLSNFNAGPTVTTTPAQAISATFVTMGGNVTNNGGSAVTERGIVYDTDYNPTTASTHKIVLGSGTGSFSKVETGLAPNRLYVYRAYAINSEGTSYGENQTFTTKGITEATSITRNNPVTSNAQSVSYTVNLSQAVTGVKASNFTIPSTGLATPPAITNISGSGSVYVVTLNTGTGSGSFQLALSNTNGVEPFIGNLPVYGGSYTIDRQLPQVTIAGTPTGPSTAFPVMVTFSKPVTGFTASDINTSNATVSNFTGSGDYYTFQLTPTSGGKTQVTIPAGAALDGVGNGNSEKSFSFNAYPTVTTTAAQAISATFATMGGNVTDDGGLPVTERGIVYDTDYNPTTASTNKIVLGSGTGSFSKVETGLAPNRFYVYRAYAINSLGTSYGENQTFTTKMPTEVMSITRNYPMNTTSDFVSYNITLSQPVTGLTVSNFTVPATGFITPPAIRDLIGSGNSYVVTLSTGTGSGTFQLGFSNTAGIEPAIANLPFYGGSYTVNRDQVNVTISGTATGQQTAFPVRVTFSNPVTGFTASDIVTINATVSNFTGSGDDYNFLLTPVASGPIKITVPAGVAIDAKGTGNLEASADFRYLAVVRTDSATLLSATEARLFGTILSNGGLQITERGLVYSTNPDPTITSGTKLVASELDNFADIARNLLLNTLYYFKAYALNDLGVSYGEQLSFTTNSQARVLSITRNDPAVTDAPKVRYTIKFSQPISRLYAENLKLVTTGFNLKPALDGSMGITGSGTEFVVTIRTGTGSGTLQLSFDNSNFIDPPVVGTIPFNGEVYTITRPDKPASIVTTSPGNVIFTPSAFNDFVDTGVSVSGDKNANLSGARITITNFSFGDQLSTNLNLTYPVTYNRNTGVLTIFAQVTVGEAETILRSIKFSTFSNSLLTRTLNYTVSDGATTSPVATKMLIPNDYARVSTTEATSIGDTFATMGGNVTDQGGATATVTERGIVYSNHYSSTVGVDTKVVIGSGAGDFSSVVTGLTSNTFYVYRAYAINSTGISYGRDAEFTTLTAAMSATLNKNSATTNTVTSNSLNDEADSKKLVVRQALSPNGDGLNDVLYIEGIDEHPKNQLLVMSSNGNKIFETQNYDNVTRAFNGRSSVTGSMQPPGTYYYLLKYTTNGGVEKRMTGYFVLKNN
ncbi:Ig-like domain-containing protein [Mucilaginibacter sp. PAMB04168]|uniref:Ig-like domain-containing protein n=1 Tax=Mucilaginibacter sp. PAMB04168 TaxID=3138567 RepID=UPI0031F6E5D6